MRGNEYLRKDLLRLKFFLKIAFGLFYFKGQENFIRERFPFSCFFPLFPEIVSGIFRKPFHGEKNEKVLLKSISPVYKKSKSDKIVNMCDFFKFETFLFSDVFLIINLKR